MTVTRWSTVSAVVAVVLAAGCFTADPSPVAGGDLAATSVGSMSPSRAASEPMDTANWTIYTSDRYGFEVGHLPTGTRFPPAGAGGPPMPVTRRAELTTLSNLPPMQSA